MKKFGNLIGFPIKIPSDSGLDKTNRALRVTGLPLNFTINGVPTNSTVTAAMLNSLGWLSSTVANMWIYLSPTGSDTTGDGSQLKPFREFTKAVSVIPHYINHVVHVVAAAGVYNDFPKDLNFVFGPRSGPIPGGKLIFDCSDNVFPVVGSAQVVAALTPVTGIETVFSKAMANDISVAGNPWTKDALLPYFVHFITGNAAGFCFAVISNETNSVRIGSDFSAGILPTDSFEIVETPVQVMVNHPINFDANTAIAGINELNNEANFCFCGLSFVYPTPLSLERSGLTFSNGIFCAPFCQIFRPPTNEYFHIAKFKNCLFNYSFLNASTFINPIFDLTVGWNTALTSGVKPLGHYTYIDIIDSVIGEIYSDAIFWVYGCVYNEIFASFSQAIGNQNATELKISLCYLEDRLNGSDCLGFRGSHVQLSSAWIEDCDDALILTDGCDIKCDWLKMKANAIRGTNAILAYNGLNMRVDVSEFDLDGAVNCVKFGLGDVSAYVSLAVAGLWLTDTAGCYIHSF